MKTFDHLRTPVEGRTLIEASAGTGKTYALSALYVRMLLERKLLASEILVVTFTEAATEELRRRIRMRIRETLSALESGGSEDPFLSLLVREAADPGALAPLLADALRTFDEAAIFTIHGFCQRMLHEHAFESGSLFDTELVADQGPILQEVVDDFWRSRLYGAPRALVHHALRKGVTPEKLAEEARRAVSNPFLRIIPDLPADRPPAPIDSLEGSLIALHERARGIWESGRAGIEAALLSGGMNRKSYPPASVSAWIAEMDAHLSSGDPLSPPDCFRKFLGTAVAKGTRKGAAAPSHPFFGLCELVEAARGDLLSVCDRELLSLRCGAIGYARAELPKRKRERNLRSFDDLLLDLHRALAGEGGKRLAEEIRKRYKAALIDEFQDTDPVQYGIFRRIYPDDDSPVFLIGDPKQSVYGFRGADVFAYLAAAGDVTGRYTLGKSWRQAPRLVRAINALFGGVALPFVLPQIDYHEVEAAGKAADDDLTIDGRPDPAPFKIWLLARPEDVPGKPVSKDSAAEILPATVSGEIVRLLNEGQAGRALLKGRPLSPRDIAVLVRTNREARLVQEALTRQGVPSVLYGTDSVFASREAMEVGRVLAAAADPGNEAKVRAALSSDLFGVDGNGISRLLSDEAGWDAWLRKFAGYRERWLSEGFIAMARTLVDAEGVRARLLSFPDGDRRLTNLLQCIELVGGAALKGRLGIDGTLSWLAERRREGDRTEKDEHQLRLETDEKAVTVVTIHKSKGLEYEIVFCPFSWSVQRETAGDATFHDREDGDTLVRDLGSARIAENRERSENEELAERVRLLYVALTRARHRCYLVCGAFSESGRSALAYLLRPLPFERMGDGEIREALEKLASRSGASIGVIPAPGGTAEKHLHVEDAAETYGPRRFAGRISRERAVASFSFLVSGKERTAEAPDRDAAGPADAAAGEPLPAGSRPSLSIRDFPGGIRAGVLLHGILDGQDFAAWSADGDGGRVGKKLAEYGFEPAWEGPVRRMIGDVLSVPLETGNDRLVLSRVKKEDRLHEVGFGFPLGRLTPARLLETFRAHPDPGLPEVFLESLERLEFVPAKGLMKGFIDLVFRLDGKYYLLDWKSNRLGPDVESYRQDALRLEMERRLYMLQYHLYAVALDRHLSLRDPEYDYEKHFGGVFYIFLRGVDPAAGPEYGVFRARPAGGLIAGLGARLTCA